MARVVLERPSHLQRFVTAVALGAARGLTALELAGANAHPTPPMPTAVGEADGAGGHRPRARSLAQPTAAAVAAATAAASPNLVPHAAVESLCTVIESGCLSQLRELSLPGRWEKDALALLLWTLSAGALPRLEVG